MTALQDDRTDLRYKSEAGNILWMPPAPIMSRP